MIDVMASFFVLHRGRELGRAREGCVLLHGRYFGRGRAVNFMGCISRTVSGWVSCLVFLLERAFFYGVGSVEHLLWLPRGRQ